MTQEDSPNGKNHSNSESPNASDTARGRLFWTCWTCGTRNPGSADQCSHDGTSYTSSEHAQQEEDLSKPLPREYVLEPTEPAIRPNRIPVTPLPPEKTSSRKPQLIGFTLASVALIGGFLLVNDSLHNSPSFSLADAATEGEVIEPTVTTAHKEPETLKVAKKIEASSDVKAEVKAAKNDIKIDAVKPETKAKTATKTAKAEEIEKPSTTEPAIASPTDDSIVALTNPASPDNESDTEETVATTDADSDTEVVFHALKSTPEDEKSSTANIESAQAEIPLAIIEREQNGEIISFHELTMEATPKLKSVVEVPAAASNAMVGHTRGERASVLKDSVTKELQNAGFNSLQISVDGPVITINGAMSSQDSKDYALQIVRNHPNVAQVKDKIFIFQ